MLGGTLDIHERNEVGCYYRAANLTVQCIITATMLSASRSDFLEASPGHL